MAFSNRSKKVNDSRLTGLFKTKRKGLYVGSIKADQLGNLMKKLKAAKEANKGLAFFLWKNTFEEGENTPVFVLNADIEQDRSERPAPRKYVQPDDDDDDLFNEDDE